MRAIKSAIIISLLLLVVLIFGIIFSPSPLLGWYGLLKLCEMVCLGVIVSRFPFTKKDKKLLLFGFSIEVCLVSLLAILEYFHHGSLDGLWYFLGERHFTGGTPGIANATIAGRLILRPYATFPHPNVLAGYLFIMGSYSLFSFRKTVMVIQDAYRRRILSTFIVLSLFLGTFALVLSLSRLTVLLWILVCALFLLGRMSKRIRKRVVPVMLVGVISLFAGTTLLRARFLTGASYDESFALREVLLSAGLRMIQANPFFGVGLNNFLPALPHYLSIQRFAYLQPVHNIFFLVLTETGILVFLFFMWFLFRTLRRILLLPKKYRDEKLFLALLLISIVLIGQVDHYFLTLQQGQLLLSFSLGLIWSSWYRG